MFYIKLDHNIENWKNSLFVEASDIPLKRYIYYTYIFFSVQYIQKNNSNLSKNYEKTSYTISQFSSV